MARTNDHSPPGFWELVAQQHGVVARRQLTALGLGPDAIAHAVARGRLHRVERGVYAVGRPELTRAGRWLAAVLGCGPGAVLSHQSAAELWGLVDAGAPAIQVTVPVARRRRRPGVVAHRCALAPDEIAVSDGIPVTSPTRTLLDVACVLRRGRLEAAVNAADRLDLVDPDTLRGDLERYRGRRGCGLLRSILDRATFALTDSQLERRFLAIVRRAGLPLPATGRHVDGFKVDFLWPELGLVVETDGLRYHRTPVQQSRDRLRDQTHAASGLTTLRFTHAQVYYEADRVRATLVAVADRLRRGRVGI